MFTNYDEISDINKTLLDKNKLHSKNEEDKNKLNTLNNKNIIMSNIIHSTEENIYKCKHN